MNSIPESLHGRAFTRAEAVAAGVTAAQLRGRRFVRIHHGVYRTAQTPESLDLLVTAARAVLPKDAAVSHLTNLRLRGLNVGQPLPLHFATNRLSHVESPGLVVHRFAGALLVQSVGGVPMLDPYRTFVDCGTLVGRRNLLKIGDWLVARGLVSAERLVEYAAAVHFDGVGRARQVAALVRAGAESPRESELRWELVCAGLPEPEVNANIFDEGGRWLARGDLVYARWKVLVEYDGWYHERGAEQRQSDIARKERLDGAGWRVIVITAADMADPRAVVRRVGSALVAAGWTP